jgi:fibronectin-binding autotransporter adhesin
LDLGGDITANTTLNTSTLAMIGIGSSTASEYLNLNLNGHRTFTCYNGNSGTYDNRGLFIENGVSDGSVVGSSLTVVGGSGWINTTPLGVTLAGGLKFDGASSFTGALIVDKYTLMILSGLGSVATTDIRLRPGASLKLDSRCNNAINTGFSQVYLSDRITDGAILQFDSGQFFYRGKNSLVSTETIGTVQLNSGVSQIIMENSLLNNSGSETTGADLDCIVTFSTLSRSVGATLWLKGVGINGGATTMGTIGKNTANADNRLMVTAAPTLVNGIIPWAFAEYDTDPSAASSLTYDFVTYGGNGFEVYTGNVLGIAGRGAVDNVCLTSDEIVTGDNTLNSLTLNSAVSITNDAGVHTLTLSSGALLNKGVGSVVRTKIDLNGGEGLIFNMGTGYINFASDSAFINDGGNGVTFYCGTSTSGINLQNANSTYSGNTRINYGTLQLQTVGAIPSTTELRIDLGGVLDLYDGQTITLGALSGHGKVTAKNTGGVSSTLVLGSGNSSGDFSGSIINGALGSIALSKTGTGSQTLSGNNTYQGATQVLEGALLVSGNLSGTGAVTVANGATLGGNGSIGGEVTVQAGGTLTGEDSSFAGNLNLTSNLLLNAGSVLCCNLTSASVYDQIVVQGTVNLNADSGAGATLQVALGYAPRVGQQFTIIDKQSAGAISGAFANGTRVKASYGGRSYSFSINTTGGSGSNDVVLMVLPRGTMFRIE